MENPAVSFPVTKFWIV